MIVAVLPFEKTYRRDGGDEVAEGAGVIDEGFHIWRERSVASPDEVKNPYGGSGTSAGISKGHPLAAARTKRCAVFRYPHGVDNHSASNFR